VISVAGKYESILLAAPEKYSYQRGVSRQKFIPDLCGDFIEPDKQERFSYRDERDRKQDEENPVDQHPQQEERYGRGDEQGKRKRREENRAEMEIAFLRVVLGAARVDAIGVSRADEINEHEREKTIAQVGEVSGIKNHN